MMCYARPKENEVKVKLEMVLELGEMDVGDLATAIRREVRAMDIPNPDGGVMFLEHLSVVVKEVESSKNLPEVPTCTKSQTDAERYRWLRGGSDVPSHSVRWPRWEVRNWDGRHWQTLFAEQMDSAIDAAMSKDLAHNA